MSDLPADTPAAGQNAFADRVRALDALLAACCQQGALAGAEMRDTSNRSNRDWPWWSVEISYTRTDGAASSRVSATISQACTATGGVGELHGSWRGEAWRGVSANYLDLKGHQPLAYPQLATPAAFLAVVDGLLRQARQALATAV